MGGGGEMLCSENGQGVVGESKMSIEMWSFFMDDPQAAKIDTFEIRD